MTNRGWVLVTGAASGLRASEEAAATLLGALLAREGYGLIAGTWGGVDKLVTREFVSKTPPEQQASRIVHIENHPWHSGHDIRAGQIIKSSPDADYSPEAVSLADVGVIVSGRRGSKPTMDALIRIGKPAIPLAWLGNDAFECLQDLLGDTDHFSRSHKRLLVSLIDPACGTDETISRVLGAVRKPNHDIFISYHRATSGADAGRLAAHLFGLYGTRRVFIDYESLPPAERLDAILAKASQSRLFIVMIDRSFTARVQDERDWVRREIIAAASASTATVLPVLIDCSFSVLDGLPDPLQLLKSVNVCTLDRVHWDTSMLPIEKVIDNALGVTRMRDPVIPY